MAVYSLSVARPDGAPVTARPVVRFRLSEEGHFGTSLVTRGPVEVRLPASGVGEVDLVPSDRIVTESGRSALYSVEVDWLDPDGVLVPGGHAEWGQKFFLRSGGGPVTDQLLVPPSIPGLWVRATDPATTGDVAVGDFWVHAETGEVMEQTQTGWVPRGMVAVVTDEQVAGLIAGDSASAAAVTARVQSTADAAVAPAIADAQAAVAAAQAAAELAETAAATSMPALYRETTALFIGASNVVPGSWSSMVCEHFGWAEDNFAVGGSGFLSGPEEHRWRAQVDRAVSAYSGGEKSPDSVGFVFVAGGGVDAINNNLTIDSEADYVVSKLRAHFPRAQIVLVPGLWRAIQVRDTILDVSSRMRTIGMKYGALTIWHGWEWLFGRTDLMEADADHPNEAGYRRMAEHIIQGLKGGNTSLAMRAQFTSNGAWNGHSTRGAVTIQDGMVTVAGHWHRTEFTTNAATEMILHIQSPEAVPPNGYRWVGAAGGNIPAEMWVDGAFVRASVPTGINRLVFSASWPVGQ